MSHLLNTACRLFSTSCYFSRVYRGPNGEKTNCFECPNQTSHPSDIPGCLYYIRYSLYVECEKSGQVVIHVGVIVDLDNDDFHPVETVERLVFGNIDELYCWFDALLDSIERE